LSLVFADASYWIALSNPRDAYASRARLLSQQFGETRVYTTEEVLTEFLNYFAGDKRLRRRAVEAAQGLLRNSRIIVVPQTHESFVEGLALYAQRADKGYSLTDCISMQLIRREEIDAGVLTSDHHFEQEGFRALLRG